MATPTVYTTFADAARLSVEEFASKYSYPADDDSGDAYSAAPSLGYSDGGVEEGMAELEGDPEPHSEAWKEKIARIGGASKLHLGAAYQREKEDKKHRMGDLLEGCYKVYERKFPGDPDGKDFYKWLDGMPDLDRVMMVSNAESSTMMRGAAKDANIKPSMVKAFIKGVAYLDQTGRRTHQVHFRAGTAFQTTREGSEKELSTAEMSTVFSGKGFGIWVISDEGNLYVGNHIKGMVHHSSFLAGADVMCGGEMWARNGKVLWLSAKSGHYQPDKSNLRWALQVFETCVANYADIKVAVWKGNPGRIHLISPAECFFSNDWAGWGNFNADEKRRLQAGDFASFPS